MSTQAALATTPSQRLPLGQSLLDVILMSLLDFLLHIAKRVNTFVSIEYTKYTILTTVNWISTSSKSLGHMAKALSQQTQLARLAREMTLTLNAAAARRYATARPVTPGQRSDMTRRRSTSHPVTRRRRYRRDGRRESDGSVRRQ